MPVRSDSAVSLERFRRVRKICFQYVFTNVRNVNATGTSKTFSRLVTVRRPTNVHPRQTTGQNEKLFLTNLQYGCLFVNYSILLYHIFGS